MESLISTTVLGTGTGFADFAANEYGAKLVYGILGKGGLGVLVRAGLVSPPSLVSSAVDAILALLIIDLRRDKSVAICITGFRSSTSGCSRALVRRDTFRSPCGRIEDL
jgi:hypothetical protein